MMMLMKQKHQKIAVAKKYPLLYLYVAVSVLIEVAYLPDYYKRAKHDVAIGNSALSHQQLVIAVIGFLVMYFAVFGYLALSRNLQKVALLLKVILVIQLLGLLFELLHPSYLIVFVVMKTGFTYVVLRMVQGKKSIVLF
jgi:hypothetical protein